MPDSKTTRLFSPEAFAASERGEELDLEVWSRAFTFDYSYWSFDEASSSHFATQELIYKDLGSWLLDNAWLGYNCSMFAYGQTGAGKSYTMMGTGAALDRRVDVDYGLIPRTCEGLFQRIQRETSEEKSFNVEVSYLEIYNERVRERI